VTTATAPADTSHLLKASVINGAINAVINGAIQFLMLRGHGPVALTADAIGTTENTVLGSAVPLAVLLAMILTAITRRWVSWATTARGSPRSSTSCRGSCRPTRGR
jgi:hypothetical protein